MEEVYIFCPVWMLDPVWRWMVQADVKDRKPSFLWVMVDGFMLIQAFQQQTNLQTQLFIIQTAPEWTSHCLTLASRQEDV